MNDTIKIIQNLRSIRDFSNKGITNEDMSLIINSSVSAANASAEQSYSLIVIDDKKVMKDLTGYTGSNMIVFCIDFYRIKKTAEFLNQVYDPPHIIDFITGSTDAALVVQTAVITAKSLGIDSLITNGIFRGNLNKAYDILNIPEDSCFPLISVVFGYCGKEPTFKKGRLKNNTIIHHGKYQKMDNEKLKNNVEEYNNPENHLGLIMDWEEQGFKNYMDWFFAKWLAGFKPSENQSEKNMPDPGIKIFYDILNRAGFINNNYL